MTAAASTLPQERITGAPPQIRFRTGPTTNLNVDLESRTIKDVIMVELGEATGHDFWIEKQFLLDMKAYIDDEMEGRVQCNMGHNWDNLFRQLGRFERIRMKGGRVIGDLVVYQASDSSPDKPGMGQWFLDMAGEDNKSVMCSMAFIPAGYYQYNEKGEKVYIQYSWWSGPKKQFENKKVYVEFKSLKSVDIVDQGALTRQLFAPGGMASQFNAIITHPDFREVLEHNHEQFTTLNEFYKDKYQKGLRSFFTDLFKSKDDMKEEKTAEQKLQEQLDAKQKEIDTLQEQLDAGSNEAGDEPTAEELQTQLTEKEQTIKQLQAKVKALEEEPAEKPSAGKSEEGKLSGGDDAPWMNNPINQRAAKFQEKRGLVQVKT